MKLVDSKMIDQGFLDAHEVADRHQRKIHAIGLAGRRIRGSRPRRRHHGVVGVDVDQRVAGENEIFVGVDRLAGTDDRVPITGQRIALPIFARRMARAGEEMADQYGVGSLRVQRAVAFPADAHVADRLARDNRQDGQFEDFLVDEHGWPYRADR
jgi:hypothetical protein